MSKSESLITMIRVILTFTCKELAPDENVGL